MQCVAGFLLPMDRPPSGVFDPARSRFQHMDPLNHLPHQHVDLRDKHQCDVYQSHIYKHDLKYHNFQYHHSALEWLHPGTDTFSRPGAVTVSRQGLSEKPSWSGSWAETKKFVKSFNARRKFWNSDWFMASQMHF